MNNATTFVTRTVLIKNTNTDLYAYFDEFVYLYQFLYRKVYHNYRHNLNNQKESQYRSDLMKQFNITNRMAKAILDNEFIKYSKYIYGSFYLKDKQAKNEIRNILKFRDRPLSYKIIKCNNKLYLHIMFKYNKPVKVDDSKGVLGIDFNKGFITMSHIDENGKLLKLYKMTYIHKAKTGICDNSLNNLVNDIIKISLDTNKIIVIEDLKSLNNKKLISDNKKYNSMINLLKFSKFKEKLINKSCKVGSDIKLINPAYTSQIAKNKYCYTMKLNVHSGASYVIARRYYNLD